MYVTVTFMLCEMWALKQRDVRRNEIDDVYSRIQFIRP